jgi:hypothetical protein
MLSSMRHTPGMPQVPVPPAPVEPRRVRTEAEIAAETERERVVALGKNVRHRVENTGVSLLEAVEAEIESAMDRPLVYRERMGWWRAIRVKELSPNLPEDAAKIAAQDCQAAMDLQQLELPVAA